ncbi:hypothetical protein DVS77_21625 [Mycolicibacterium moriokaense]|nr:hypothetical protein DVS77_21625 [Mycolicibacterium moriokaense]
MGDTYNQFYNYSFSNRLWLLQQGVREPVASYKRWQALGRQVMKGSTGYYILRPITVKLKDQFDDEGNPRTITKFKGVKGAFGYSQTEGDKLPEVEPKDWSRERALGALGINLVSFASIDGNTQGYSVGLDVAINPMAVEPEATFFHEAAHVVGGHTTAEAHENYRQHRGLYEFEAEGSSYLLMNELELPFNAEESRAYIQGWLRGDRPPDTSIRKIFKIVDTILNAGYAPTDDASIEAPLAS